MTEAVEAVVVTVVIGAVVVVLVLVVVFVLETVVVSVPVSEDSVVRVEVPEFEGIVAVAVTVEGTVVIVIVVVVVTVVVAVVVAAAVVVVVVVGGVVVVVTGAVVSMGSADQVFRNWIAAGGRVPEAKKSEYQERKHMASSISS